MAANVWLAASGGLLKTYLFTVTKRNSEDKTLRLHFTQSL
jgi:hypothetical protein